LLNTRTHNDQNWTQDNNNNNSLATFVTDRGQTDGFAVKIATCRSVKKLTQDRF